jgi:hypothetical protein
LEESKNDEQDEKQQTHLNELGTQFNEIMSQNNEYMSIIENAI